MAAAYRRWADSGAQFHFVSSSPWQLYEPLSQFLRDAGFPDATFHLKRFRIKDRSFLNLFVDPVESKQQAMVPLVEAYPQRQFVLVGDSGEKDPEVYGMLARRFPQRIAKIYIRNVTNEPADSARYRQAFEGLPADKWHIFDDPQALVLPEKQTR
jgi:phosphatidate phosphatase APP1